MTAVVAHSGRWVSGTFATSPKPVETFVSHLRTATLSSSNKWAMSSADIERMFSLQPTSLNLEGLRLTESETQTLSHELTRSSSLTAISFKATQLSPLSAVLNGLLENLTVERVDFSQCDLAPHDAVYIAENVIPWNRCIVDWNFAGNMNMGDEGVMAIVHALTNGASSVQRLNLRGCGIRSSLRDALLQMQSLTALLQLDVAENDMYHDPPTMEVMRTVDELLHRNCKMLHPSTMVVHTALYDASSLATTVSARHEEPSAVSQSAVAPLLHEERPVLARRASLKRNAAPLLAPQEEPRPSLVRRGSVMQRNSSFAGKPRETPAATSVAPRDRGSSLIGREKPFAFPHQAVPEAAAVAADFGAVVTEMERTSSPKVEVTVAAPALENGSLDDGAVAPCAPSPAIARPTVASGSVARYRSPSRQGSNPPGMKILAVDAGYEEWKRVKEEYNQYIRSPSAKKRTDSPSIHDRALQQPKYVLGKLVSRVVERPSSAFKGPSMYIREPTPAERRALAPWREGSHVDPTAAGQDQTGGNHSARRSASIGSSYVGKQVILLDPKADPRHRTAIRFVDGGDITCLNNDPRDIGYVSRRLERGEMVVKNTCGFNSNAERDCRWGVDAKTQMPKRAQAPGPGAYVVPSDIDKLVKKAQQSSRSTTATGRQLFGSSAAPRSAFEVKASEAPGPGFYEIP